MNRPQFQVRAIYRLRGPKVLHIAKQKLSFLIAILSLFAFAVGNLAGQHGIYALYKIVLGKELDSSIPFVGMVTPVRQVPDYSAWASYGGTSADHTYRQVPTNLLTSLPAYDAATLHRSSTDSDEMDRVYSIGYMGSYASGQDHTGSHPGVDIRVPVGTPVFSIANGVVESVAMLETGYGHNIVIRHPNVPDPDHPGQTTMLFSSYAHLDSVLVSQGQVVRMGEQIATSGQTGLASGPHLHFQIDRADAPFHPYWPFTTAEQNAAHLSFNAAIDTGLNQSLGDRYTISPVLLVQRFENYIAPAGTALAAASSASSRQSVQAVTSMTLAQSIAARRTLRLAQASSSLRAIVQTATASSSSRQTVTQVSTVQTAQLTDIAPVPAAGTNTDVDHLRIDHSGTLSRMWQKVRITALDRQGNPVASPLFTGRLYVIADFGQAEIRPSELSPIDFVNGVATVNVLARGTKTLFIGTRGAFTTTSAPMVYVR